MKIHLQLVIFLGKFDNFNVFQKENILRFAQNDVY